MIPATSFFREVVMYVRAGNAPHIAEKIFDPAFKSIIKHAQCDAQGNFSFSKLPGEEKRGHSTFSCQTVLAVAEAGHAKNGARFGRRDLLPRYQSRQ